MIIDLHTHSYYSADGKYSIPELLDFFSAEDIAGLTDHETIGGWEEYKAVANKRRIKPVLGLEWFAYKCHILCYFINEVPQEFLDYMADRRKLEKSCMFQVYQELKKKYPVLPSYEKIMALRPHPEGILGLPALGQALSKTMNISKLDAEDIARKEKRKLPMGTVRPMPFYTEDLIEMINSWNGVSVLAHPYRKSGGQIGRKSRDKVEEKIRTLAKAGLRGVELFSDGSTKEEVEHLLSLCDELGLVAGAGSDKHTPGKSSDLTNDDYFKEIAIKRVKEWLTPLN